MRYGIVDVHIAGGGVAVFLAGHGAVDRTNAGILWQVLKCDNNIPTVALVKFNDRGKIIGVLVIVICAGGCAEPLRLILHCGINMQLVAARRKIVIGERC